MLLNKSTVLGAVLVAVVLMPTIVSAQTTEESVRLQRPTYIPPTYAKGVVLDILEENSVTQKIRVQIQSGNEQGKEVDAQTSIVSNAPAGTKLKKGDVIVVVKDTSPTGDRYYASDYYRIPPLIAIGIIFMALVIILGRWKGFMSLLGLLFSIGVLAKFIVPQILAGNNPFWVSLFGSFIIAMVAIYLAHGMNRRTTIALVSTVVTLGLAAIFATLFVSFTKLFGTGTEEALYLQIGTGAINLRGLLLGGIIIGALGVLDDITTAQCAVVDELKKANPMLTLKELYTRGLSVGKEHIAALVNTLALAYAGVGLPLFLLFFINKQTPLWVVLNGADIAEEIVRTLVGSTALILAVPIATLFAAIYFARQQPTIQ